VEQSQGTDLQDMELVFQGTDWVGAMLDEVVGDHEIL